jgi:hypothetical protein
MFPSDLDKADFAARFGVDAHLQRMAIPRQRASATTLAAFVMPKEGPEATLALAWDLARSLARWLLDRIGELPANEVYAIVVGWSKATREHQGQIFKLIASTEDVRQIVACSKWVDWEQSGHRALLPNWQRDVFARPAG